MALAPSAAERLHVVGVRHHSPACARVVKHAIETLRPRHVLIEGPADMNARLGELSLGHALPVAIFTFYRDGVRAHSSWTPFCSYSPEWVAIETGREVEAEIRFCDLPAWDAAFEGRQNRYADQEGAKERDRSRRYVERLREHYRVDDTDALWDHLFEQPMPVDALGDRLRTYFEHLRGEVPGGPCDGPREAMMARFVAWALGDAARQAEARGDGRDGVLVVCGGWHAPVLRGLALAIEAPDESEPTIAPPISADGSDVRHGSYLVPYTYKRLDSFAGYESGMPSPTFHELVHEHGAARAIERSLELAIARVRKKRQPMSTADLIAARTLAQALASLRGHEVPTRTDLLDGLAGALVKDGMEVPFPWARRGPMLPRTEPILVEIVAALSGDREGKLAPGTPRPPLLFDVQEELRQHELGVELKPRAITLSLRDAAGRAKSRVLHRLGVLQIPGFTRVSGPTWATDSTLDETWTISAPREQESALIEASAWGATLETAALSALEERMLAAEGRLRPLSELLGLAVFVGIGGLASRVIDLVARAVGSEPSLGDLGAAAARLLDVTLHGELLDARGAAPIDDVLVAAFDRGLWLLEGVTGATAPLDEELVRAVVALRDVLLRGPSAVASTRVHADGVFGRKSHDPESPPAIRGACLGALWSLDRFAREEDAIAHAVAAVKSASLPAAIGDFLAGLFAVARTQVLHAEALIGAVDESVSTLGDHELLVALPSLRLAFSYFPPREKEDIAKTILRRHGGEEHRARTLLRLDVRPHEVAAGLALDREVTARAARHGLADELDLARVAGEGEGA